MLGWIITPDGSVFRKSVVTKQSERSLCFGRHCSVTFLIESNTLAQGIFRFMSWIFSEIVILVAFARLRKATVSSSGLSVHPSVWNTSAPTVRIVMKFYIWVFFENLSIWIMFHANIPWVRILCVNTYVRLW